MLYAMRMAVPEKLILTGAKLFFLQNISTQLLKREDANVIIVDWGNGSAPPYSKAVANIRVVGRMTAVLIYALTVSDYDYM